MNIKFERKFLRADELLQRWQCSEVDLKHELIEGNLCPIIFVKNPEEVVDREGRPVFGPDEGYTLSDGEDDFFGKTYLNRGYLVLRSPIREGINTCSFSLFSPYQDTWDHRVCLPEGMFPLEPYWHEMVFDLPSVLRFEMERTQGAKPTELTEKPLASRERDTLLTIIAVLCKAASYDAAKHAKTAGLIQDVAAGMGVSIGETTIEGHLKRIPNALAGRTK